MATKSTKTVFSHPIEVSQLARKKKTTFELNPSVLELEQIREALALLALRKLAFIGRLEAVGRRDWRLRARLGVTIVQPCVTTLAPVTTRIEEDIERIWRAEMPEFTESGSEEEMPEDTSDEPLAAFIDLGQVLLEALTLALPQYPRAKDASMGEAVFTAPGVAPLRDEDLRPFAGLADLRAQLAGDTGKEGGEEDSS